MWSLWESIVHATQKMKDGITLRNVMSMVDDVVGEGEVKDSLMIMAI